MIETPALVAVGSLNPTKVNAVSSALARAEIAAEVRGVAVPSGVSTMPTGHAEVAKGAIERAHAARAALDAGWGIGLEGGVTFDARGDAWLFSVAAIITSERESLARGGELLLPPPVAARLRAGAELGPLMDELLGTTNIKQGVGAIGYLTRGLITREAAFHDVFCRALAPLLHVDLYAALARGPAIRKVS
jgi:inosine/xanthosine triphosphatase